MVPRHSWLGVHRCWWSVAPRHSWLRVLGVVPRHPWLGVHRCRWWVAPRHSWLRVLGVVPRHSWLGVRRCWWWVAPRHPWLRVLGVVPRHSWLGSAGCGDRRLFGIGWGVSRVLCVCGAACARGVCVGVCVVCSWCPCWCWCGCGCVFPACLCVCVCLCGVLVARACRSVVPPTGVCCGWVWLVCGVVGLSPLLAEAPERSSGLGFAAGGGGCSLPLLAEGPRARLPATPGWGPLAVVLCGPLPFLAAGPGRGSPPLLAGVRWRWWCGVWSLATPGCGSLYRFPRHSWLRVPGAVLCHSWLGGPLVSVVGGPSPLLAEGPGVVPRHSWLGPPAALVAASLGFGGVFPVLCVLVPRRVRVVSVLARVWCVRGVCVGGAGVHVSTACVCAGGCACAVCWWFVGAGSCFPWLGLGGGVGGGAACVCCGWSLATPGGGS